MKSKHLTLRRISSLLLAVMMCISLMPAGVFADSGDNATAVQEVSGEAAALEAVEAAAESDGDEPAVCAHDALTKVEEVKATCASEGTKEYYKCDSCGKMFFDASCENEVTSESLLDVAADPDAHQFGEWKVTKEATSEEKGEETRTCGLCGKTETEEVECLEPEAALEATPDTVTEDVPETDSETVPETDPVVTTTSMTLDGVSIEFKEGVATTPLEDADIVPGRVWIKGAKKSMKVNWVNPANVLDIDGVIILKATGKSTVFSEAARIQFKSVQNGETVINTTASFNDKAAKKKNTVYTYRVISYSKVDGVTYVSHLSKNDWAAGQTSASKLKNVDSAKISKKSATLQSNDTLTLKVTVASAKKKYKPKDIRWYSNDTSVVSVSSKGKVTAKIPGTAIVFARMASGNEVSCKITVVGALKPGKAKLKVDYVTDSAITLIWSKADNATSYDIYKSDDGLHWDSTPKHTNKTTITYSGLIKKHRYTFYVIAVNEHKGLDENGNSKTYKVEGDNSNVIYQDVVIKRRPMTLTGFPTTKEPKTGTTLTVKIKVKPPLGRKAELQMLSGKKWVKKKTIKLPKGGSKKTVKIKFPNDWWGSSATQWRLVVPPTTTTDGFTTDTLKITPKRNYQNPSKYVQIKDEISKHGYKHYVSPVLVNGKSSKSDHVDALIKTAKKYMGDKYVQGKSGAPGKGIDESGLIMQACYGAGVDLWPVSPSTRPYNCIPKIMDSKLKKITYKPAAEGSNDYTTMTRGDLIFFSTTKKGTPIHAAIYTGLGGIIHADPIKHKVNTSTIREIEDKDGDYGYYVVGVRRIFN